MKAIVAGVAALVVAHVAQVAQGHAYLSVPAARQVLTPGPYGAGDIQSLSGGGPALERTAGHGLCGDNAERRAFSAPGSPYGAKQPRVSYAEGSYMDLEVTVTAHHWGWFELRLCVPADGGADLMVPLTQDCLNQYVLEMDVADAKAKYGSKMRDGVESPADYEGTPSNYAIEHAKCAYLPDNGPVGTCCRGGGDCSGAPKRWVLPDPSKAGLMYKLRYKLPAGVTAQRAVLQWTYQTGNSIDGYPETFWNCADIAIVAGAPVPTLPPSTLPPSTLPPTSGGDAGCYSISPQVPDAWCQGVKCDPVYSAYCQAGTGSPSATPPTTAKPTTAKPVAAPTPVTSPTTGKPTTGEPTTSAPSASSGCHSISPQVSHAWCQGVLCDPVYSAFCSSGPVAPTTAPPTAKPSTGAPSTSAPVAAPTPAPAPTAPTAAPAPTSAPTSLQQVLSVLRSKASVLDNQVLIYQQPDLSWVPSTVYHSADMVSAVQVMASDGAGGFKLDVGTDADGAKAYQYGLANLAAFLAQAKKESIQYNACDENSWDLVNGVYPLSNACGQLAQSYQDYTDDPVTDCPLNPNMEITATTNAKWYGAPPPLKCGPRAKTGPTVGWSYSASCGPWGPPTPPCDVYPGQKGGAFTTSTAANSAGRTDTENCCWWGRGVIQSTGRGNYGKLNYYLGAKAASRGAAAPYGDVDFCSTPDAVCASTAHPELKWVAGFFYWMNAVQSFATSEFNYSKRLRAFVDGGYQDSSFIDAVSGIVNRGCPRATCSTGPVDGLADRRANFALVLSSLGLTPSSGRRLRAELGE